MLEFPNLSKEKKKVIVFKWTAEHRELLKSDYTASYTTIRNIIGGNNETEWPSNEAIRKQLNKWGYTRNKYNPIRQKQVFKKKKPPIVESPPLAAEALPNKQLPHPYKEKLFTCPEGYIGKTILTVKDSDCKWIYGIVRPGDVSGIVYCGKPGVAGIPYCEEHCRLVYNPQS